jgi:hypothetical protein
MNTGAQQRTGLQLWVYTRQVQQQHTLPQQQQAGMPHWDAAEGSNWGMPAAPVCMAVPASLRDACTGRVGSRRQWQLRCTRCCTVVLQALQAAKTQALKRAAEAAAAAAAALVLLQSRWSWCWSDWQVPPVALEWQH